MLKKRLWHYHKISKFLVRPWLWSTGTLDLENLDPDPFKQFANWYERAQRCFWLVFPEAMCLSTISSENLPDSRMVLMKGFDSGGITFYSNKLSRKGQALSVNPLAALNYYWEPLARQVRIQGTVEELSEAEADEYFSSRPRISQIGAWASKQSSKLENRAEFEKLVEEFQSKYQNQNVPRPEYWIGYRVIPQRFEFWQMRVGRLHDRFEYFLQDNNWTIQRLSP